MVTFKCQRVALGPEQALSRLCGYKQMAQLLSLQGKISLHRWSTVIFSNINNKMLETALQPVKIPCPKDGNRRGCFWGISVAGYIRKEKKNPPGHTRYEHSMWNKGRFLLDRMVLLHFIYFAGSKTKTLCFVIVGGMLCPFEAFRI